MICKLYLTGTVRRHGRYYRIDKHWFLREKCNHKVHTKPVDEGKCSHHLSLPKPVGNRLVQGERSIANDAVLIKR